MDDFKYPIGKFVPPVDIRQSDREKWIEVITETPRLVKEVTSALTKEQ